jgi:hypothetical protein
LCPLIYYSISYAHINLLDAVFFGTYCGLNVHRGAKRKSLDGEETIVYKNDDVRCCSLKEAVKFAKQNNLLGVICGAQTLVRQKNGLGWFHLY